MKPNLVAWSSSIVSTEEVGAMGREIDSQQGIGW
jgi:hypothetical protein